jgi:anti-sigma factor ChrR (cupin superfamily)
MSLNLTGNHDMATDEIHEVASLYSLGLLDPELSTAFERHLDGGCTVCESEVCGFTEATAQVLTAFEGAEPPARVRDELMKRIGRSAPSPVIYRAGEGEWQDSGFPGLTLKQLFVDPVTGNVTSLLRMTAGAVCPPHRHFGLEHCYVLEGDVVFDDHTLYAGDYEVAAESIDHSPATTRNGCLLLIMNHQQDQQLA